MKILWVACVLGFVTMSAGCDVDTNMSQQGVSTLTGVDIVRPNDAVLIAQGRALYIEHCSRCHGQSAEGDARWRKPDAQGYYPAPPLNGSGHAWHHPRAMLHRLIKQGSPVDAQGFPQGKMPAWGQLLDDRQIDALIAWFQSLWPDPVYAIWYERQQRSRGER